jgi:glutathione S-transferase
MHLDKLPSIISRYRNEVRRVLGVLNTALEGKRYLVGDKVTIADLSFVPWHSIITFNHFVQLGIDGSEFLANIMGTVYLHGRHGLGDERISER